MELEVNQFREATPLANHIIEVRKINNYTVIQDKENTKSNHISN